LLALME